MTRVNEIYFFPSNISTPLREWCLAVYSLCSRLHVVDERRGVDNRRTWWTLPRGVGDHRSLLVMNIPNWCVDDCHEVCTRSPCDVINRPKWCMIVMRYVNVRLNRSPYVWDNRREETPCGYLQYLRLYHMTITKIERFLEKTNLVKWQPTILDF